MGITKKGEHCLTGIHLNVSELKVKPLIKYSISVPNKLIETKKLLGKPFKPLRDIKHLLTRPFTTAFNNK